MSSPPLIIADRRGKWAHVSIPKCGCKSIRRALEKHFGLDESPNVHNRQWPCRLSVDELRAERSLFRWAVVRDPRARLVSIWAEKTQRMLPEGIPGLAECYKPLRGASFPDFALWATSQPVTTDAVDIHIRACSWWLVDTIDGDVVVDAVYRLEDIGAAWKKLGYRFGFPPLSHLNKSQHKPWRDYVTPELNMVIKHAYGHDFALWYRDGIDN